MKNRTLLYLLLTVGFVGFTSCGDEEKIAALQADNKAMQAMLASGSQNHNVNVTNTITATAVANVTVTSVHTSSSTGTVTTATASSTSTAGRL